MNKNNNTDNSEMIKPSMIVMMEPTTSGRPHDNVTGQLRDPSMMEQDYTGGAHDGAREGHHNETHHHAHHDKHHEGHHDGSYNASHQSKGIPVQTIPAQLDPAQQEYNTNSRESERFPGHANDGNRGANEAGMNKNKDITGTAGPNERSATEKGIQAGAHDPAQGAHDQANDQGDGNKPSMMDKAKGSLNKAKHDVAHLFKGDKH